MLFDIDSFREIGQALSRNRSRTLLTGFGIFWGIFMLLTMLGAGDGLKRMLSSLFDGFATNTVICGPAQTQEPYGGFQKGRTWTLNTADLGILRSRVPGIDVLTPILSGFSATPEHKERSFSGGRLSGVYPDYSKISTPRMKFGRYINSTDVEQKRKVCVIGRRVYEKLFPGGEDPTGQFIRLKETGNMFMIVGVNSRKSAISIGGTDDSMITVPFSVLNQMYSRGDRIDLFCMTVKKGWTSDEIQEQVRSVLFHIHGISPTDKEALMAIDTAKIFSIVDESVLRARHPHTSRRAWDAPRRSHRCQQHHDGDSQGTHRRDRHQEGNRSNSEDGCRADNVREHSPDPCRRSDRNTCSRRTSGTGYDDSPDSAGFRDDVVPDRILDRNRSIVPDRGAGRARRSGPGVQSHEHQACRGYSR